MKAEKARKLKKEREREDKATPHTDSLLSTYIATGPRHLLCSYSQTESMKAHHKATVLIPSRLVLKEPRITQVLWTALMRQ